MEAACTISWISPHHPCALISTNNWTTDGELLLLTINRITGWTGSLFRVRGGVFKTPPKRNTTPIISTFFGFRWCFNLKTPPQLKNTTSIRNDLIGLVFRLGGVNTDSFYIYIIVELKSLQFDRGNIVWKGIYRYFYLWKLHAPLVEFLPTIPVH